MVKHLSVQSALSHAHPDVTKLLLRFPNLHLVPEDTLSEFSLLARKEWKSTDDPVSFWAEVSIDTDSGGNKRFKNISSLALAMFSLPFSNAAIERVFSMMSIVKCKLRNRLQCEMVNSILALRYGLMLRGETCCSFTVTAEMLQKFNNSMYENLKSTVNVDENVDVVFSVFANEVDNVDI